jgi:hypothetical protein
MNFAVLAIATVLTGLIILVDLAFQFLALSRKSREFSSYRERRLFEGQSTSLGVSEAKARFDRPAIAFGPSFEETRRGNQALALLLQ